MKKALKNNICLPRPVRAVKDSLLGEKNGGKIGKMCDIVVSDANIINLSEVNKYHIPNQLFEDSVLLKNSNDIYLMIEEYLFFKQYAFHKQKIAFHRASMKAYEKHLLSMGKMYSMLNLQILSRIFVFQFRGQ